MKLLLDLGTVSHSNQTKNSRIEFDRKKKNIFCPLLFPSVRFLQNCSIMFRSKFIAWDFVKWLIELKSSKINIHWWIGFCWLLLLLLLLSIQLLIVHDLSILFGFSWIDCAVWILEHTRHKVDKNWITPTVSRNKKRRKTYVFDVYHSIE